MLGQLLADLGVVDQWLDDSVSRPYKDQPMAQDWARISKIAEELGEAISAWIIHTGQNPRKPQVNNMHEVVEELADVAFTAILCMLHFTKDAPATGAIMLDKARRIYNRMNDAKAAARRDAAQVQLDIGKATAPAVLPNPYECPYCHGIKTAAARHCIECQAKAVAEYRAAVNERTVAPGGILDT